MLRRSRPSTVWTRTDCRPPPVGARQRRPGRARRSEQGEDGRSIRCSTFHIPPLPGADGVRWTLAERLAEPASRSGASRLLGRGWCHPSPGATPADPQDRTSAKPDAPNPLCSNTIFAKGSRITTDSTVTHFICGRCAIYVACALRAICETYVIHSPYVHFSYILHISHLSYISHISVLSYVS